MLSCSALEELDDKIRGVKRTEPNHFLHSIAQFSTKVVGEIISTLFTVGLPNWESERELYDHNSEEEQGNKQ